MISRTQIQQQEASGGEPKLGFRFESPSEFQSRLVSVAHGDARRARSLLEAKYCELKSIQEGGRDLPPNYAREYAEILRTYGFKSHAHKIEHQFAVVGRITVNGQQLDTLLSEGSFDKSRSDQSKYAAELGYRMASRAENRAYVDSLLAKEKDQSIDVAELNALKTYRNRFVRDDQGGLGVRDDRGGVGVDGRRVVSLGRNYWRDDVAYPNGGALFVRATYVQSTEGVRPEALRAATTPAQKFSFQPGKLYIRRLTSHDGSSSETLHFEIPGQQWRMRSLAQYDNGTSKPSHSTRIECQHEASGASRSGNRIEHILAADDDVRRIVSSYQFEQVPITDWLQDVSSVQGLDPAEAKRVERIVQDNHPSQRKRFLEVIRRWFKGVVRGYFIDSL